MRSLEEIVAVNALEDPDQGLPNTRSPRSLRIKRLNRRAALLSTALKQESVERRVWREEVEGLARDMGLQRTAGNQAYQIAQRKLLDRIGGPEYIGDFVLDVLVKRFQERNKRL